MIRTVIADDAKMMRDRCKVVCRGISAIQIVGEAEDGADAVKLVEQLDADLLLSDVQMLQMTGVEAGRILKEKGNRCKVVLCTSMGQAAAGNEFPRMIKPFHAEQLRAVLYQLFGDAVLES